jgi:hypothetical protein
MDRPRQCRDIGDELHLFARYLAGEERFLTGGRTDVGVCRSALRAPAGLALAVGVVLTAGASTMAAATRALTTACLAGLALHCIKVARQRAT